MENIKRIALILILGNVLVTSLFSQEPRFTPEQKTTSISKIIKEVESKSDYTFFINDSHVDVNKTVTVSKQNATLKELLDEVFSSAGYVYEIVDKQIVVYLKRQVESIKKTFSGRVTDAKGESIIGATIKIKGSSVGTVSDFDGSFSLPVSENDILEISYMGFITTTMEVKNRTSATIILKEDTKLLDEVVVIAYGTVKKSDLTGAVSSVKTKDLPMAANTSISHMLAGQAAGVKVTQTSAQPGGGIEILIRGAASTGAGNEPLYVIDGFPITNKSVEPESGNRYEMGSRSPLNSINPNDIESIEILKDASSSAIYGARAANGVILITTKRGKSGKPIVNYNMNLSMQKIDKQLEMLSARDFMKVSNEMSYQKWRIDEELAPYGDADEEDAFPYKGNPYTDEQVAQAGAGTNWYDLITRTGNIQQHNVSVSAGSEDTRYLFSVNYFKQNGVVKNSDFRRISGRINIDQNLGKYFKMGINTTYSDIFNNNVPLGNGNAENSSLLNSALQYDPLVPVRDEKGDYALSPTLGMIPNPVSLLEITDQTKNQRLLASGYVSFSFLKNFEAKLNVGIDRNSGNRNTYLPQTTLYGKQEGGKANINNSKTQDMLGEFTLRYGNQLFKKRDNIDVLLGYSYQKEEWDGISAGSSQFFTDLFLWNKLEAGNVARPPVSSYKGQNVLASYFARVNYSLMDRYLITLSARSDGSSKFGKNNRRAFFPSGAIAWKMQNEKWLREVSWLDNLKIRFSYGQTGNSNIGENAYEYFTVGNSYVFGESVQSGSYRSQLGNPNLKWETTTEMNIGIDFGFFRNRISGSVEYFNKVIDDLLSSRKLNSLMEVAYVADNIGSTQSTGYEISINTVNIAGKFNWSTSLNLSSYNDRWKKRNPDVVLAPYQKEDDPIRAIYGYKSDGVLQIGEEKPAHMPDLMPGQMKIQDVNGFDPNDKTKLTGSPDGKIDDADRVYLGTTDPSLIFGIGNTFSYSGFDLNIFFHGVTNQIVWNANRGKYGSAGCEYILQRQNYSTEVLERWTPDNPTTKYPSGFYSPYPSGDTWLMQKIWYLRCKNITLGYTFPDKWVGKVFSKARMYVDFGSPFVFTNYEGLDPEMDSQGGYPTQRTYSIGLDITF